MSSIKVFKHFAPLAFGHQTSEVCDVDIHLHDGYEIFQALSPNIRYFVEGNAYDMNTGDIMITTTKEIHRPITVDKGSYDRRFIHFAPEMLQLFGDLTYNPLSFFDERKPGIGNYLPIPGPSLAQVNHYFQIIETALKKNTNKSHFESRLSLYQLLLDLDGLYQKLDFQSQKQANTDPRIQEVRDYLDQHYTDKFDLDRLSKHHLIDKYYLSHLFKASTGFSLLEYVQSKRIQKAKILMTEALTISEISTLCGFEDYTNFYKTFKKLVHQSPKAYRDYLSSSLPS